MASFMDNAVGTGQPLYCYSVTTLGLNELNSYNVTMFGSNEHATLIPGGIFRFTIKVNCDIPRRLLLYRPSSSIPCQTFFEEGQDFFRTLLSPLSSNTLSCTEIIEQIVELVASELRGLFQVDAAAAVPSSSSESHPPEIPLWIVITVTDSSLLAAIQELITLHFKMIPASKEAIETSLKKSMVMVPSDQCCPICMEELDVNAECYTMPCDHLFHQGCIVHWLQTSHTCPLCRYPLSTLKK